MDLIFRFFCVLVQLADKLVKPIFWLASLKPVKKIPKIEDDVLLLSAVQIANKIRRKEVTSYTVVSAYINRIKLVNPIINAVSEERFEKALAEAKEVDYYVTQNYLSLEQLTRLKPFFGVPITIKESCGLKGMSHTVGSVDRIGIKCDEDHIAVQRLKNAGFVPLLVSTCPEYCIGLETNNLITGLTRNPYNTNRVSGGSSGGEAALLGSGCSVVGLGTDFAGSIRLPSMFNGIFGHKMTPNIIERKGHFPNCLDDQSENYFAMGPMTRYAKDLKPIVKVIAAEHGLVLDLDRKVDMKEVKVFYTESDYNVVGIIPVQNIIRKKIRIAASFLNTKYEVHAQKVNFSDFKDALEIGTSIFFDLKDVPDLLKHPTDPQKHLNLGVEIAKSIIGKSRISIYVLMFILMQRYNGFISKRKFPYYFKKMQKLKTQLLDTLGHNGVLLYPTFPTSAFQHYQLFTKTPGVSYSMIFNILGCPATQVPVGLDSHKMPIGIQVIAAPNQDRLCLAVAEELEKCFGGWIPPYSI